MENKMYLIHEEDYIQHIDEKAMLYSFVKQLAYLAEKMKPTHENASLLKMAKYFDATAEELFSTWGIPKSYLVFGKKEELMELMENELIAPEDASFYPCGEDCPCGSRCCDEADSDNADEDEDDEFAEMVEVLSALIHKVFGDNVSVHVLME